MDPVTAQPALSAAVLLVYVLAAAAHLAAFRRARLFRGSVMAEDRPSNADRVYVQGGLLVAAAALASPLVYWSGIYMWVRGMQAIMLAFVAPALIAAGRPWLVARSWSLSSLLSSGGRGRSADVLGGNETSAKGNAPGMPGLDRARPPTAWSEVLPVLAAVLFNAAWLGLHLPGAFDSGERDNSLQFVQNVCYLGFGLWFWLEVGGARGRGRWHAPLRRLGLVTATVAAGTVLGMALVFGENVVYPAYQNSAHHIMTALDDQQLSGAILWMGGLPSLVVAGVALLNSWLNEEEADKPADLSPMYRSRTASGWPSRPRLR